MEVRYVVKNIHFTDPDWYWVSVYPEGEEALEISIPVPRAIFESKVVNRKIDTLRLFVTEALKRITNPRDYVHDDILTRMIGEKIVIEVTNNGRK